MTSKSVVKVQVSGKTDRDAADMMTKAKVSLVNDHPFFGSVALRYPSELRTDLPMPTMATDGRKVFYHPDFVNGINREQCTGVVAHEVCHIIMMHHLRRGERHPQLWNIACDFVINPILIDSGFQLPPGGLIDNKYSGMTAEHVYEMLLDDVKSGKIKVVWHIKEGSGSESMGNGKKQIEAQDWGDVQDSPDAGDSSKRQAEEAEIKVRVMQAAATAKSRGKLPQAFEGLIEQFSESKVNWRERIRTFVGGNKPDDWSYRRPNRKHMALSSVYLPTIEYTGAGVIVVAIDGSGSVSNEEVAQFLGEIKSIHGEMRPDMLHVVWCDTQIQHEAHYGPNDEFDDHTRHACGGTILRPAFEWVEKHGVVPDSFIYLSDMEIGDDMNDLRPSYPVLWVATGPGEAPFGDVIRIVV